MTRSVLLIVPYENIYPPVNGGMQRCFNLINQFAKRYKVTLIINQEKHDFLKSIEQYPSLKDVIVYSTKDIKFNKDIFSFLPGKVQNAFRYRWYKKSLNGPADGLFLSYYPLLLFALKRQKFDIVILENLATLNAVSVIRKLDREVKIVYDAHNVDSDLAMVAVDKWNMKRDTMQLIQKVESTLYKKVDAVICCSLKDQDILNRMNGNRLLSVVIPNGVTITKTLFDTGVHVETPLYVLFCGTLSATPNSEGLLWFYSNCWSIIKKTFPDLKLLVVGSGIAPDSFSNMIEDESVEFSGMVTDVRSWYDKATAAIVPLISGSGTRLKILEAMSLGVPIVSTSKGAEGIKYTHGQNIIIADTNDDFCNELVSLLKEKTDRYSLQQKARKLVEVNYDWDVIGDALHEFVNKHFAKVSTNSTPRCGPGRKPRL